MNPNTPPPTDGPVFLGSYWDQPLVAIEPTLVDIELSNDRLLFAGKSHVLFAPSAAGKTFVAVQMALSVIQQTTRTVLFLDYESSLDVLLSRFRQLGGTRQEADRFAYWRIEDPIPNKSDRLQAFTRSVQPALVILDGVTQSCAAEGVDADRDNGGYTRWYRTVERAVGSDGDTASPALLLLDHFSEKSGFGLHSRGATAKRDTVTGRAMKLEGRGFSRERGSTLSLVIAKCRLGGTQGTVVANVVVVPSGQSDGTLSVRFVAPQQTTVSSPAQSKKRDIVDAVTSGASSVRQVLSRVSGDQHETQKLLRELKEDGYIGALTDQPMRGGQHPLGVLKPYPPDDGALSEAS